MHENPCNVVPEFRTTLRIYASHRNRLVVRHLIMKSYGPTLRISFRYDRANWPDQIDRACQAIESEFPGNPIDGAIVFQGSKAIERHIADRKAYLKARTKTKLCRFTLDNHFSCVAASGVIGPLYFGRMGLGGTVDADGSYTLMAFLPPNQADHVHSRVEHSIRSALASASTHLSSPRGGA